jgi:hypothetical protein
MASEELAAVCVIGIKRARCFSEKIMWVATLAESEEEERVLRAKRLLWWDTSLLKCAPVLSGGNGLWRGGKPYGFASNYGRMFSDNSPPLSAREFYDNFRFAREQIPVLVVALRIPQHIVTQSNCRIDGEEAMLVFLKVIMFVHRILRKLSLTSLILFLYSQRLAYPNRLTDLMSFFRKSIGALSEIISAVRVHLHPIAHKLLMEFDHRRIIPLLPVFAAAFHRKGCPLPNVWALVDGTFRWFCRPAKDGYRGAAQEACFSGHTKGHGNNHQVIRSYCVGNTASLCEPPTCSHCRKRRCLLLLFQGVETADGIVVEMNGPNQGRTNDMKMLAVSKLLERCLLHCVATPGYLYCLFGDRGYVHGHPALQVPYKGVALTAAQSRYNGAMSKIRQPVEWSFGKISTYFAFVDFEKNQKLYLQPVGSYWLIATMLTNCHS